MRFLFTTLPTNDLGLLTRSLPIAEELSRRHEVRFCSPARVARKLVADACFGNRTPRHALLRTAAVGRSPLRLLRLLLSDEVRREHAGALRFLSELLRAIPWRRAPITHEIWSMDDMGAIFGMLNRGFVRANCEAMRRLILDCGADVVVDFWNPFACIAARSLGTPLVSVLQADEHPANRGFIWWRKPAHDIPTPVPAVNAVLRSYGLDPVTKLEELALGDLTLMLGTPETDPVPAGTPVTHIGSILWQKPGVKLPPWLAGLDDDKPLIWIYSGNPQYGRSGTPLDSAVVVEGCIEALANEDAHVALTTGHHALPPETPPLPHNFHFEPFLPGLAMAENSDLLIHHGGYGSCQTGLHTGTPAVIIPTFSERESNARRVAALGAGDFVLPRVEASGRKRVPTKELTAAIRRVLADTSYAARAKQVSEDLRAHGGAREAATLVEHFAEQTQRRSSTAS